MEVDAVLALIDKNSDYLDELYKEFNVLLSEVRFAAFFFRTPSFPPVVPYYSTSSIVWGRKCISLPALPANHTAAAAAKQKPIIRIFARSLFLPAGREHAVCLSDLSHTGLPII